MWLDWLKLVYVTWVYPMWKWLLRRVTGKCELLRIVYSQHVPNLRIHSIETSLHRSRVQEIKRILASTEVNLKESVEIIMRIKDIVPEVHPEFGPTLCSNLTQILGYKQLVSEVEALRKIPYSSENPQHEDLLLQLWSLLKPSESLTGRVSKQWGDIGFQGEDPMTDFRGMGILGLQNLLYFAKNHNDAAVQLLSHSAHPKFGYSFAIVGINITGLVYQLLLGGYLKSHFYNSVQGRPEIDDFHQVYCCIFYQFDGFWFAEKPRDIMEFNNVKSKFKKSLKGQLKDKFVRLSLNVKPESS